MKSSKFLVKSAALLAALSLVFLSSCGDGKTADSSSAQSKKTVSSTVSKAVSKVEEKTESTFSMPTENNYSQMTFNLVDIQDHIKINGRYAVTKTSAETGAQPCLTFDHTGQMLAFNADCEGDVVINMSIKCDSTGGGREKRYYRVFVDDVEQERLCVPGLVSLESKVQAKIATGLKRGKHSFRMYRETELNFGYDNLISVTMNGLPTERPQDKKLYIEFLGDSITAGYGDLTLVDDKDNPSYPEKSSGVQTYAFKTAQALDADMCAVARSGLAYTYGLGGMPIEDYWTKISWTRSGLGDYDFKRQPDVVVINLGTNDHQEGNKTKNGITDKDYYDHAVSLLNTVRKTCPNAKIIWYYGMMGSNIESFIMRAVNDLGGADKGFYYLHGESNFGGGGYHPSQIGHEQGAVKLTNYIKGIL